MHRTITRTAPAHRHIHTHIHACTHTHTHTLPSPCTHARTGRVCRAHPGEPAPAAGGSQAGTTGAPAGNRSHPLHLEPGKSGRPGVIPAGDYLCGSPHVLRAVRERAATTEAHRKGSPLVRTGCEHRGRAHTLAHSTQCQATGGTGGATLTAGLRFAKPPPPLRMATPCRGPALAEIIRSSLMIRSAVV